MITVAAEIVGLTLILHWIFKLIFGTIAEHSFMVMAINRLYTARTNDEALTEYITEKTGCIGPIINKI